VNKYHVLLNTYHLLQALLLEMCAVFIWHKLVCVGLPIAMASDNSAVPSRPTTAVDLQQFISVAYDLANTHMDGVAPFGGPGSTAQSDVEQLIKKIQYNMAEMGRLKEMHTLVIQLILFRREEIGKQLEQLKVLADSWKEPNLDMDDDRTNG